jgi:cyclopropane-fatty-acyl-phospholipid synthase
MASNKTDFVTQPYSHNHHSSASGAEEAHLKPGQISSAEKWLTRQVLMALGGPSVYIALPDGSQVYVTDQQPKLGMVVRTRKALWRFLRNPRLYFGIEYSADNIEVEGDLVEFVVAANERRRRLHKQGRLGHLWARWVNYRRANSFDQARHNIHAHYDLGNDFFKLWLDESMVYTCAYFPDRDATLEQAQFAKMDYIGRKLYLKPGETVVDAGCGWGSLALHLAKNFGVRVKAFNISHQQIIEATNRARQQGLQDQVEFIEDDYRNITGSFDAFVSVGMLEHVGTACYPILGNVIDNCLREHGRGLVHSIGQTEPEIMNQWANTYIFPGAYIPTLQEMMDVFVARGFSVLDVENLRLHYAKTLSYWLQRFDEHEKQVTDMYDENFVRSWRLYLGGAMANFLDGDTDLFQVVFTRPHNNAIPITRAHLYADDGNIQRDNKAWTRATS